MTELNSANILLIAPPGRKRENLVTLSQSAAEDLMVFTADHCQQVLRNSTQRSPSLILIDARFPSKEFRREIKTLQHSYPTSNIVLLKNRLCQQNFIGGLGLLEVIYDDLNIQTISQWIQTGA